jgi:hypothetical protein
LKYLAKWTAFNKGKTHKWGVLRFLMKGKIKGSAGKEDIYTNVKNVL